MKKPLALIDLDGTLVDYSSAMKEGLDRLRGPSEPILYEDAADDHPWLKARCRMIKSQPGWWYSLKWLPAGQKLIEMIRRVGFRMTVLTRGPKYIASAWAEKMQWCRDKVPDAGINITLDKAPHYGRVLVDDWPEYVEPWLHNRPRGLVVMPDQPWNQGFTHPQVVRYIHTDQFNSQHVEALLIEQFNRITK